MIIVKNERYYLGDIEINLKNIKQRKELSPAITEGLIEQFFPTKPFIPTEAVIHPKKVQNGPRSPKSKTFKNQGEFLMKVSFLKRIKKIQAAIPLFLMMVEAT